MLGLNNRFEKGQFVQEISFKHNGLPRKDLGIEKFGFVNSHAVIARNYHEYLVVFASNTKDVETPLILDYCLRPVTEAEIREKLAYIATHQADFKQFIISLNDESEMITYHIEEDDIVKEYRNNLLNINLTVAEDFSLELSNDENSNCSTHVFGATE